MNGPASFHQRKHVVRNLRAAPSWLTPRRIERVLAVLDRAPTAPVAAPASVVIDEIALERVVTATVAAFARATAAAAGPTRARRARPAASVPIEPAPTVVEPVAAPPSEPVIPERPSRAGQDAKPAIAPDSLPVRRERVAEIASALSGARRPPRSSALEPEAAPVRPAPGPAPVAPPAPSSAKPFAGREIEKLSQAVAWLRNRSISIRAASTSPIKSTWAVSGYIDPIGPEQVIALARKEGFEA